MYHKVTQSELWDTHSLGWHEMYEQSSVKITISILLCLSDCNETGANMSDITMECGWCQNKDYVGVLVKLIGVK